MEKILDFKKTKHSDDFKLYRFQCDCLCPTDAMDIEVESCGQDSNSKFFILCLEFRGSSFWNRLKYAWQILRGHWCWREFVVRDEDTRFLSDIFNPDKKFSELP